MKKKKKPFNIILNIATVIVICVLTLLIVRNTCYQEVYIIGDSMSPTLKNNEHGYMNTTKHAKKSLSRFEIVILNAVDEFEEEKTIVKRVIGLPGETIRIESATGIITINGQVIEQKFIEETSRLRTCSISKGNACDNDFVIPQDEIFVLGDNRGNSLDSESKYGSFSKESVVGVLTVIYKKCNDEQKACKLISPRFY